MSAAKLHAVEAPREVPELRAAFAAETAAVANILRIRDDVLQAEAAVTLRERDRGAMAARAARGEAVTGADIRAAMDAIEDAKATVELLRSALPMAASEAKQAASARHDAVKAEMAVAREPMLNAAADAKMKLNAAQRDYDAAARALANVGTSREFVAHLSRHGEDTSAASYVAHLWEVERTNGEIEAHNLRMPSVPRALLPWPPA